MIDIKFLRENPDVVKENIKKKYQDHKLVLVDEVIELDIKNLLENNRLDFFHKMVYDNLVCEYKNFKSLLEGFERACKD